jgi:hypothetical protein
LFGTYTLKAAMDVADGFQWLCQSDYLTSSEIRFSPEFTKECIQFTQVLFKILYGFTTFKGSKTVFDYYPTYATEIDMMTFLSSDSKKNNVSKKPIKDTEPVERPITPSHPPISSDEVLRKQILSKQKKEKPQEEQEEEEAEKEEKKKSIPGSVKSLYIVNWTYQCKVESLISDVYATLIHSPFLSGSSSSSSSSSYGSRITYRDLDGRLVMFEHAKVSVVRMEDAYELLVKHVRKDVSDSHVVETRRIWYETMVGTEHDRRATLSHVIQTDGTVLKEREALVHRAHPPYTQHVQSAEAVFSVPPLTKHKKEHHYINQDTMWVIMMKKLIKNSRKDESCMLAAFYGFRYHRFLHVWTWTRSSLIPSEQQQEQEEEPKIVYYHKSIFVLFLFLRMHLPTEFQVNALDQLLGIVVGNGTTTTTVSSSSSFSF